MQPFLRDRLARARRDDGMTLIEIMIVLLLLGLVLAITFNVLFSAQNNFARQVSRTASNDQVKLAMGSIDREVRSGDVLYNPANENYSAGDIAPGMSMRIYTESNYATRGSVKVCVQWRISSAGNLQFRRWTPVDPAGTVTGWRTVASGITNRTDNVAAFARPNPGSLNIVNIVLRANDNSTKGNAVEVDASIAGRNTQFFSSSTPCGPSSPAPVSGPDGIPAY